jgi:hypothetical protein
MAHPTHQLRKRLTIHPKTSHNEVIPAQPKPNQTQQPRDLHATTLLNAAANAPTNDPRPVKANQETLASFTGRDANLKIKFNSREKSGKVQFLDEKDC